MRYMIKRLYQRLRTTTVYVTHDQVEAMTIGEMLVVLKDGRIHQVGSPAECYTSPADTFVASFLGSPPMNLLDGEYLPGDHAAALDTGQRLELTPSLSGRLEATSIRHVTIGVRPEVIAIEGQSQAGRPLSLRGKIVAMETLGHDVLAHVDLGNQEVIVRKRADRPVEHGDEVFLLLPEESIHFFSKRDGHRIGHPEGAHLGRAAK
jgi:ABC-type sugar transport system ATPase subunit